MFQDTPTEFSFYFQVFPCAEITSYVNFSFRQLTYFSLRFDSYWNKDVLWQLVHEMTTAQRRES